MMRYATKMSIALHETCFSHENSVNLKPRRSRARTAAGRGRGSGGRGSERDNLPLVMWGGRGSPREVAGAPGRPRGPRCPGGAAGAGGRATRITKANCAHG
ncbi:unnamed protein product, partial [Brenthis ino]